MGKLIDLTGQKFGRLTIIKVSHRDKNRQYHWVCKCKCGNEKIVLGNCLKNGTTRSCGCYNQEKRIERMTKHGKTDTRLFIIWRNMKNRCYNPKNNAYKSYGNRGITVCNEWQEFKPFYDWAINNGYTDDLTIDRIDVNGNYEPSNCRWVDKKVQANNRQYNRLVTYKNETHTVTEWAEKLKIKEHTIYARLNKGMTDEEALEFIDTRDHLVTYMGKTQTVTQWSEELNINVKTLYTRFERGWSPEKAFKQGRQNEREVTLNGKTQSLTKWASELGLNHNTVTSRIYKGWSIERALTTPARKINKK